MSEDQLQQQQEPTETQNNDNIHKKRKRVVITSSEIKSNEEGFIAETVRQVLSMTLRDWLGRITFVCFLIATAIILWKLIIIACWSEIPIVVVLSESMYPGYTRGDMLVLSTPDRPIEVGDITVFKIEGRDIPIVHRIHKMHIDTNGTRFMLTKGDNNFGDDRSLYNPGQNFIKESDVMGRSVMYLPYVGQFTIMMAETPYLREVVIVLLLFAIFVTNEE